MDRADQSWFDAVIRPPLHGGGVDMVGDISDDRKSEFLSGADALLMPIAWPEPFGLVMIEAMARGMPVIAFNRGSAPEIIDDGVSGVVVNSEAEAIAAVSNLAQLSRNAVRARFMERFSARRMAGDYLATYRKLARRHGPPDVALAQRSGAVGALA